MEASGGFLASLSVYFASPISILVALSSLSSLSDTLSFLRLLRVSDMKTVGRRTSERLAAF